MSSRSISGKTGLIRSLFAHQRFPLELAGTFSKAKFEITGAIDDALNLEGIDLKLNGSGRDLSALGSIIAEKLPATDKFAVQGQLTGSAKALSLKEAQGNAQRGSLSLTLEGGIKDLLNFNGVDLVVKGSGKDLSEVGAIIEKKLPATDEFAVEGRLTGSAKALALKEAQGSAKQGSLSLALSGGIKDLIAFSGVDLKVKGSGKDLTEIGPIIGKKPPTTDKFAVQGRLAGSTKALSLREAQGSVNRGSLNLAIKGEIKNLLTFSGMDLQLKGSGKDLAEIGPIIDQKLPATDQFTVQARLTGSAKSLSLQQAQGSANRGSLNLTLNGGIEELPALNGINFNVKASGKELAEIGPMVGADLPELGPFDVSTALSGSAKAISINEFEAILDKSDFKGLAKVEFRKRPKVTMQLESSVLDFTGLMKSLEKDQQALETEEKREHRLFPDDPLPFNALKKMDADIVLKARNIHVKDARLEFGHLSLKLEDSDFSIDKLEATYKQTKISGNLNLKADSPTHAATSFLVQNLDLGGLLKEAGVNDQVRAHVDIGAHLKSRGDSVRALMANLDGSIGATMGQGYLTHYLDLLSINLTQKVTHFWKLNQSAHQIKCAVIQFDIKDGIAISQAFVFDTQLGTVIGEGKINLGTEQVNFLLVPKSKDLITVGVSPKLRVTGMLLDAKVSPDKLSMLKGGAKALSSLAIGPLGLLAPFVHLGAVKNHPCDIKNIGQLGLSTTANE
jgi:uncharacterized protein involved in outer membrane biogenesis